LTEVLDALEASVSHHMAAVDVEFGDDSFDEQ
jgi:hypothetical protein